MKYIYVPNRYGDIEYCGMCKDEALSITKEKYPTLQEMTKEQYMKIEASNKTQEDIKQILNWEIELGIGLSHNSKIL